MFPSSPPSPMRMQNEGCSRAIFYRPPKASVLILAKPCFVIDQRSARVPLFRSPFPTQDEAFRGSDVVVKFPGYLIPSSSLHITFFAMLQNTQEISG